MDHPCCSRGIDHIHLGDEDAQNFAKGKIHLRYTFSSFTGHICLLCGAESNIFTIVHHKMDCK